MTLESNHTTGYSWQLADGLDRKKVDLVGSKYNEPKASRRVGQGGTETGLLSRLVEEIPQQFSHYARPWEKNVAPIKTQRLEISVR